MSGVISNVEKERESENDKGNRGLNEHSGISTRAIQNKRS